LLFYFCSSSSSKLSSFPVKALYKANTSLVSGSKWDTEVNDLVMTTPSSKVVDTGSNSSVMVTKSSSLFPISSNAGFNSSKGLSVSTIVEIIAR
jgi:hypothetical protein